jgi:hypothetical protein
VDQSGIDEVFGHFRNYPHDGAVASANDGDDWLMALGDLFEVLEALIPVFAHVVEEEAEVLSRKVEVDAVDLPQNKSTSISTISFPTPPPEPLFMNKRIDCDPPCMPRYVILRAAVRRFSLIWEQSEKITF